MKKLAAWSDIYSQDLDYLELLEEVEKEEETEDQMIQKIIAIKKSRGNKINHFIICNMSFDYSS